MECYYYQYSEGGSNTAKERRPPVKRGHVKVQIARTLSGLVVPASGGGGAVAAGDSSSKQAGRNSFRREPSLK
ncbi:hypothetical protein ACP4OV_028897 [Aristida adscensionis]